MKPSWLSLIVAFLYLALAPLTFGTVDGPFMWDFRQADTIYLVRVASLDSKTISFSVTETLRGTPVKSLSLVSGIGFVKPNDEFLIFSSSASRNGPNGNRVDAPSKQGEGWHFADVRREGPETYIYCPLMEYGLPVFDKKINDFPEWITLDHLKRLLKSIEDNA